MPGEKGNHGGHGDKGNKGDRGGHKDSGHKDTGRKEGGHKDTHAGGKAPERHTGAPVSGRVSSGYGTRTDPKSGAKATHKGVDIAVKVNTSVKATGAGTVVKAGWQDPKNHKAGYGQRVTVSDGCGNTYTVGHLNKVDVKAGDKVKAGQVLGKSGNTGKSTGPHVHYEERYKGKPHAPTFHPDKYKPQPRKPGK